MKALYIDGDYFYYPHNVNNFKELKEYLKDNYSSFVELTKLDSTKTVPPFFIEDYSNKAYVNLQNIQIIEEVEISVMSLQDYKTSLNNAMEEICSNCDNFNGVERYCDCGDIQENLCLNGQCSLFSLADDDYL